MDYSLTIVSMIFLFFALVIIWISSFSMIKNNTILDFFPFLILGVILIFYTTLFILGIFLTWTWIILELSIFSILVWIYLNIAKVNLNG